MGSLSQRIFVSIFLSFFIHISTSAQTFIKSVTLTPNLSFLDGANVHHHVTEVHTQNNEWNVLISSQSSWAFVIVLDPSWGFSSTLKSSIRLTINSDTIANDRTFDKLLFGFTSNGNQYISTSIAMDNAEKNQIYPACSQQTLSPNTQSFANGHISSIPNYDRQCDIAGYNCLNYKNMQPQTSISNAFPISFTLTNDPINNLFSLAYESAAYPPIFGQQCNFMSFPSNSGLKVYIGGNNNADSFSIQSFNIEAYSDTASPTTNPTTSSPTKSPSRAPSKTPTKKPTNMPSFYPTNAPTSAPSKTPSNAPSSSPSHAPTNRPSHFPSNAPSHAPVQNPTSSPSQPPSAHPSYSPTAAPSLSPSASPSKFPSNSPLISPTQSPLAVPSRTPTYSPTHSPTQIPSKEPTKYPSKTPTGRPSTQPTISPTGKPSVTPTMYPTIDPTEFPTDIPTADPTKSPSKHPSIPPTKAPTKEPTQTPTLYPTLEQFVSNNALSDTTNKSLIASFAGMAVCFGCVAIGIFIHSKKKHATDLKNKSNESIKMNNTKTVRIEMNSKSNTTTATTTKSSTRMNVIMPTSKTVSIPSTTIYESIENNKGEDDDDEIFKNVNIVLQQPKKKRKKRRKKKKRVKNTMYDEQDVDVDDDEEDEVMVLNGPGSRKTRLEDEFNKLTLDMGQVLKYGVTPNGQKMTKGYTTLRTKRGNIVTKV